jgi:germination protein M
MTKKFIVIIALLLVAVSLLSGGCSQSDNTKIKAWKDLLKLPTASDSPSSPSGPSTVPSEQLPVNEEKIMVKLYFLDSQGNKLVVEERNITKTQGIARQTMNELLKGPSEQSMQASIPVGTRLLDINVKPEGLCIVDLSSDVNKITSRQKGQLMVQAIASTLGQFPSIKEVSFLVNGEKASTLGGLIDVARPVSVDYSL